MRPINSKVTVEMHTPMEVTASGIHIPPTWQKPSGHATVVAVANSCKHVKVGDYVAFRWIDGRDVDLKDGRKLKSLQEAEILAIVGPTEEREKELEAVV